MAVSDTNIQIQYANFSLGPQIGTFATIDTSNPATTQMLIKNNTGGLVASYFCDTNLTVDVTGLEYIGPSVTNPFTGATFFSFQRYSSSHIVIRRWELDADNSILELVDSISKTDAGVYSYDCNAFAVEHYLRSFDGDASPVPPHTNEIRINSKANISAGDEIWLGPSTDTDNVGAVEKLIVDSTYTDGLGDHWVVFTTDFTYEYVSGDDIWFAKNIYLFSDTFNGDSSVGAVYKLNAYTGANSGYANSNIFRFATAAAWNDYYNLPSFVRDNTIYHISPSLGYVIYRRHECWTNVEDDLVTLIPVVDLIFDDTEVFKLQDKVTYYSDDGGTLQTASWGEYNYHSDSQIPYSNSLKIWRFGGVARADSNIAPAGSQFNLACLLVDQRGFPVSGKEVQFYSDDPGESWNPADAKVTTDSDGYGELIFTSGSTTEDHIEISARAAGGDASVLGSQYIWCFMPIISKYEIEITQGPDSSPDDYEGIIHQFDDDFDTGPDRYEVRQIDDEFIFTTGTGDVYGHIKQLLKFDNPGGNWIGESRPGGQKRTIRQLQNFSSEVNPQQWDATSSGVGLGSPPSHYRVRAVDHRFRQIVDLDSEIRTSQLYQAHHRNEYLSTEESIDQFIFILEVSPAWYSVKNPIVQDIYLRITPFAYDLNQSTFIMRVKNDWVRNGNIYSTGWKNVTGQCTISTFGAPLGLEISYDPAPDTWEYNSRVWVWIQVYDEDPADPNLMDVVYWWSVIDDYSAPTITNQYPTPYAEDVNVDTSIRFDVLDSGYGVDPDSIALTIEGSLVSPLSMQVITNGYRVTYNPPSDFFYGQQVEIAIEAEDLNDNLVHDVYYFTIAESDGPYFHGAFPRKCAEGIIVDSKVSLQIYGVDHGIDTDSIIVKIDRKNREIKMIPIIYRLS
jgi:hypothetical protein